MQQLTLASALVNEKTVEVREADATVDTDLDVKTGDRLIFNATGTIWSGVVLTRRWGPDGAPRFANDPTFPLVGAHKFCLLGKLDGEYFEIGSDAELVYNGRGSRLFLEINDNVHGNGNGAFICHIQQFR